MRVLLSRSYGRRRLGQVSWPGAPLSVSTPTSPSGAAQISTRATIGILTPDFVPVVGALVRVLAVPVHGSRALVDEGLTDSKGRYVFERQQVPTDQAYRYDIEVTPGDSDLSFIVASGIAIPDRISQPLIVVCPSGTDTLVCEVAEKQVIFQKAKDIQMEKWNDAEISVRMGHAEVRNTPHVDSRLTPYVNYQSYGIADVGIPPADWPEIVERERQMARILEGVPWPEFKGEAKKIGEYFKSCTLALPITEGLDGVGQAPKNWRLYSSTWSDYFPRSDRQIRVDLASRWLMSMDATMGCISHKLRKKAREVERSAKMFATLSLVTAATLAPMLGPVGSTSVMLTEGYSYLKFVNNLSVSADVEKTLLSGGLLKGTETNSADILTNILVSILLIYLAKSDLNPVAKAVITNAAPQVADLVVEELLSGSGLGASDVSGTLSADAATQTTTAVTAVGVVLVKLAAQAVRAQGIKEVKEFGKIMTGLGSLQAELVPFYIWCMRTLKLDEHMELIAAEAGIELDAERDIIRPMKEQAQSEGVDVPAGAEHPEATDQPLSGASTTEQVLVVGGIGAGALALALVTGIIGS